MSQFSVIFNPATDNQEEVIKSVRSLFAIYSALGLRPAATVNVDADETGDTPTTATHDSTGLPHDARIHSTPAALTSKGVWRAKRGVDKQLVATVEAELRGAPAATEQPPAVAAPAVAAPAVAAPAVAAPAVGVNEARTATTPGLPTMPALAMPTPPAQNVAYAELCKVLSENQCTPANPQGRLTDEWIKAALTAYLVPGGILQNAAAMDEVAVAQMVTGIKTALGMAV